jgi:6-phosphogluconolactonase
VLDMGMAPAAPHLRVFSDLNELSLHAAESAVVVIRDAVQVKGTCSVALSGGSTPPGLYRLLASRFREDIPWAAVHIFWGDERYVPPDDSRSNYRMARETLLDHVPCPAANIHPMPTYFASPDAAARDYEATLRNHFSATWPRFDLMFLGLGPEGHTASLFPGSLALDEQTRWVLPVLDPPAPPMRLTLTLPVLSQSMHTYFLVSGSDKGQALHAAIAGSADPHVVPAAGVHLARGVLIWWVDKAAAADRDESSRLEDAR